MNTKVKLEQTQKRVETSSLIVRILNTVQTYAFFLKKILDYTEPNSEEQEVNLDTICKSGSTIHG